MYSLKTIIHEHNNYSVKCISLASPYFLQNNRGRYSIKDNFHPSMNQFQSKQMIKTSIILSLGLFIFYTIFYILYSVHNSIIIQGEMTSSQDGRLVEFILDRLNLPFVCTERWQKAYQTIFPYRTNFRCPRQLDATG